MADQKDYGLNVKQAIRDGDRMGAIKALFRRGVINRRVQASNAYTPEQKREALYEASRAYDLVWPFNDAEIVYYNKLMRGEDD